MTITNPVHIAFLVMVALIFLGPKRLPELARSLGSGMREFRDTLSGATHHDPTPSLTALADDDPVQPGIEVPAAPPSGPPPR